MTHERSGAAASQELGGHGGEGRSPSWEEEESETEPSVGASQTLSEDGASGPASGAGGHQAPSLSSRAPRPLRPSSHRALRERAQSPTQRETPRSEGGLATGEATPAAAAGETVGLAALGGLV